MEPTYYIPFDNLLSHLDKIEELKKDLSENANILYKELDEAGAKYEKIDYGVVIDVSENENLDFDTLSKNHNQRHEDIMKRFEAVSAKRFEANKRLFDFISSLLETTEEEELEQLVGDLIGVLDAGIKLYE